jgi:hypothetical protein
MRPFRSVIHWRLWKVVEDSLAFMCRDGYCRPDPCKAGGIGDAPFRGYSLNFVDGGRGRDASIVDLQKGGVVKYRHPVPRCSK